MTLEKDGTAMQGLDHLPVNVALVVKAEDLEGAKALLQRVDAVLEEIPGLRLIYKNVSADKLWIQRGEAP